MTKLTSTRQTEHDNPAKKTEKLKDVFIKSEDVQFKEHKVNLETLTLIYIESLINPNDLDQYILPKLGENLNKSVKENLLASFQAEDITSKTNEELSNCLLEGKTLFQLEDVILCLNTANMPNRQPEESAVETSIRGPKDGFVEDIKINISLVRRRLNTPTLCLEKFNIGRRSNTKVAIMYLEDVIDPIVLEEIRSRLNKVQLDILINIYDLESFIRDKPFSIFPTIDYTGRPDFIAHALNQGRFALLVDGNPTVSYAPISLLLQTKSPEDMYNNFAYVSLERIIRFFGVIVTGFLPGIWVAFSAFNIDQIPYFLVATISVSRFGIPFSATIEMFIVLFLFELFNEAGIRLPRAIGQTVAVLGGLIVGDAAIRAGLTSPTMLVVAAITYISSFTLVNQSLTSAFTIIRFFILLLSTLFGLFGVILGFIITILYLSTLTSFGVPYLGSLAPISGTEALKAFLKLPRQLNRRRTSETSPEDSSRGGTSS
ncbi:spore germination protein [Bacillus mesophilum]|uniref:spore germination protein n=1 Tax=Bacillus mesophilum TaxID=1071718 RepID=UPI001F01FFB8|nr:spore germination protein [Bacillus mesophilum]